MSSAPTSISIRTKAICCGGKEFQALETSKIRVDSSTHKCEADSFEDRILVMTMLSLFKVNVCFFEG